ncbi:hypothetical protein I4641_05580 [Waterburya agarophytonicola K14]|uniref:Uncharacterized protein n=1 Tax=Waterburya agarophytonicola KI4 TaxID=2874699 RepID=A0A964BN40_9CYAN|nr:hypothetical protein [Waterburya agarophytonicola]MCC0176448.1 hypothetical protein [Waterburya agarophytonicola KI4]
MVLVLGTSGAIHSNKINSREAINRYHSTIIKAKLSPTIRSLSPNFVCSNVNAVRVKSWDDRNYWSAVNQLNPAIIRIPGGEGSSYWDWRKGGIIDNLGDLPGSVSEFLDNQRDRSYNASKLEDLQPGFQENNKIPLFVLNMLSDDLPSQLAMLKQARDLGMPVKYIELGNEFYFPLENYLAVFPKPKDYTKTANLWLGAIKKEFPTAEIAVLGVAQTNKRKSSRIYQWNKEVVTNSLPFADAITIHTYPRNGLVNREFDTQKYPYFKDADVRFILGEPFRNWQKISQIIDRFPDNKKIWVTEYNLMEDIRATSGEKQQRIAGSWIHGIYTLSMSLLFLEDDRIDLACNHMLIGSSQFSTILANEGSFIDPSHKDIKSQPLTLSANGKTHKLLGNAMSGMTQARKINFDRQDNLMGNNGISYPALYGWKFSDQDQSGTALLLNLSSRPIKLEITSLFTGAINYQTISGSPTDLVTKPGILEQKTGKMENNIVLPAYSVTKMSNN